MRSRTLVPTSIVAVAAVSLLTAGCGGSSSTTAATTTAQNERSPTPAACAPTGCRTSPTPPAAEGSTRSKIIASGRQPPVPGGLERLPAPDAGQRPRAADDSSADTRPVRGRAGVRQVHARPRVPELPGPHQPGPADPGDGHRRRDRPPPAGAAECRPGLRAGDSRPDHSGRGRTSREWRLTRPPVLGSTPASAIA